jgi:hypothetical protein
MLQLKERGLSNRAIAVKLGFSEKAVRKRIRRLGWKPQPAICPPLAIMTDDATQPMTAPSDTTGASAMAAAVIANDITTDEPLPVSFDRDPLDRSLDRLLAAMGKLEDAAPLFAHALQSRIELLLFGSQSKQKLISRLLQLPLKNSAAHY